MSRPPGLLDVYERCCELEERAAQLRQAVVDAAGWQARISPSCVLAKDVANEAQAVIEDEKSRLDLLRRGALNANLTEEILDKIVPKIGKNLDVTG